jgi:hypothetical protein
MGRVRTAIIVSGLLLGFGGLLAHYSPPLAIVLPSPSIPSSAFLEGLSRQDAQSIRDFYAAMADIVVRDGQKAEPVSRSVGDLRNRHKQALSLAFENTGMVGRYPGLGERLDAHLLKAVGELDVPLTPALRASAAAAFAAIR